MSNLNNKCFSSHLEINNEERSQPDIDTLVSLNKIVESIKNFCNMCIVKKQIYKDYKV